MAVVVVVVVVVGVVVVVVVVDVVELAAAIAVVAAEAEAVVEVVILVVVGLVLIDLVSNLRRGISSIELESRGVARGPRQNWRSPSFFPDPKPKIPYPKRTLHCRVESPEPFSVWGN